MIYIQINLNFGPAFFAFALKCCILWLNFGVVKFTANNFFFFYRWHILMPYWCREWEPLYIIIFCFRTCFRLYINEILFRKPLGISSQFWYFILFCFILYIHSWVEWLVASLRVKFEKCGGRLILCVCVCVFPRETLGAAFCCHNTWYLLPYLCGCACASFRLLIIQFCALWSEAARRDTGYD